MIERIGMLAAALLALSSSVAFSDDSGSPTSESIEFFEKQVRPILVSRCYECHSTEANEVRGGLRLDSRDGWATGGDSGPAIVPENPDESLLIAAVRYGDESTAMPPKGKLPVAEIEILTQWVLRGAPDPRTDSAQPARTEIDLEKGRQHWAYQPVRPVPVPAVRQSAWPRNDIDRFILARQEAQGLTPTRDATPEVLIRRVYFDLIGLPPSPEEIAAFVSECTAGDPTAAYQQLVTQLLASPHFGERWGRHWLDVARYAESLTLRGFVFTDAWRYRDYVIDSFNQDRPFDQMIREQVAGDLLPADDWQQSRRQVTATAFLAIGNTNLEEQDKAALVMDVVDEQIDTISKAFLAQTVTCARCHDHKFDPIPTADYYALAGILKSTRALNHSNVSAWIQQPLAVDAEREAELVKQEALIQAQEDRIKQAKKSLAEIAATPTPAGDSPRLKPISLQDLPGIVVDDAQAKRVGEWTSSTTIATYVGEGYIHDADAGKGTKTVTFNPELPESGQYEVRIAYPIGANRATNAAVTVFSADGEFNISLNQRVPGDIDGRFQKLGRYRFEKAGQSFVIVSNAGTDGVVIADAVQFIPVESLVDAKEKPPAPVISAAPPEDKEAMRKQIAAQIKTLEAELKQLTESGPRRERIISVREDDTVGDTQIHVRGNVHNLGAKVPRGFLRVLPVQAQFPISSKESGRLQLAQWLAHPENPLPARVMVNRIWHHLFGVGLVRTVDNFGTTGEQPSHPELLDHLATRYREVGMSTKSLIREIVLSRTYQLASETTTDVAAAADPENRLLTRANRRRLDAECIRDAMLLVSGQLDLTPGGPSYKPNLNSDFEYKHTDTRRSVYSSWFRNGLPEVLEAFDIADPSMPTGRRNVSTVATQALFMLNHPWVGEQATAAARKLRAERGLDDVARLDRAFRLTLGRDPTSTEREISLKHIQSSAANSPAAQNAAWANLLQSLFASIDFRYVE